MYTPLTIFFILGTAICWTSAQEYDFESQPRRPAPARIQPGYSGSVERVTPVPILKQINRHNEDGSYTYGYEGADGSFKIETKSNTGDVKGKYGYVDGDGKLKVVEYGADKNGFQPSGEGITVPTPTLVDETINTNNLIEENEPTYFQPAARPAPARAPTRPRPQQQKYQDFSVPQQQSYQPQPSYSQSPVPQRPLSIPGAQPSGIVYSERPKAYTAPQNPERFAPQFAAARPAQPAPVHQNFEEFNFGSQPQPQQQQQPQQFNFQPAQRPQPQPHQQQPIHYAQQPIQRPSGGRSSGSILDQLAKDYALPNNGAPALHDITFGAGF